MAPSVLKYSQYRALSSRKLDCLNLQLHEGDKTSMNKLLNEPFCPYFDFKCVQQKALDSLW